MNATIENGFAERERLLHHILHCGNATKGGTLSEEDRLTYVIFIGNIIHPLDFMWISWKNNEPSYRYIIEKGGYRIFCPVGNSRTIRNNGDHIVMPRVNLDSYTMNKRAEEVKKYDFDVEEVLDHSRPPLAT